MVTSHLERPPALSVLPDTRQATHLKPVAGF